MLKEFKAFILRGNVVDLAVGIIIGAAFTSIVSSLVADIITPILLQPVLKAAGAEDIAAWKPGGLLIGKFIAAVIIFIITAFVLFIIIRLMNSARIKQDTTPAAPAPPPEDIKLLTEIRDLLKNR